MTNNNDQRFDIYNADGVRIYKNASFDDKVGIYHWRNNYGFIAKSDLPKGWEVRPVARAS